MNKISLLLLLAMAVPASVHAEGKCVPVTVCDESGKNCHPEDMCSVYSDAKPLETKAAKSLPPPAEAPVPLIAPKPACEDKPVAGQPRKPCK